MSLSFSPSFQLILSLIFFLLTWAIWKGFNQTMFLNPQFFNMNTDSYINNLGMYDLNFYSIEIFTKNIKSSCIGGWFKKEKLHLPKKKKKKSPWNSTHLVFSIGQSIFEIFFFIFLLMLSNLLSIFSWRNKQTNKK